MTRPPTPSTGGADARIRPGLAGTPTDVDLLVIGLGVTGTGVALDAAARGLSVLAVDAHDVAGPYTITDIRFVDNVFSNARYGCVGYYGVWFVRGAPTDGWRRTGNRILETGASLDTGNPVSNGFLCR